MIEQTDALLRFWCAIVVLASATFTAWDLPAQDRAANGENRASEASSDAATPKPSSATSDDVISDDTMLPWNLPAEDPLEPPVKRLSSAREMLELFSIDRSQIDQLIDRRPLDPDEEETLLKILYRIPYFGADKIEAWCKPDVTWSDLVEVPELFRLDVVYLNGRAIGVERIELPVEVASRFEFTHYYRVHFRLDDAPHPVLICCRTIPEAWIGSGQLDERAGAYGLYLKVGSTEGEHAELVFAAERVAWMPEQSQPVAGITADHVLLADAGLDLGLLDEIRETNRRELEPADRECFYQMLAAVGRIAPQRLFQLAGRPFDVEAMLTRPEQQQGRLFQIRGTARRVQKIVVNEEDIRERFGIGHYYQIDIFVPLGDEEVRLGSGEPGEEVPVFRNSYPVTCCTLELPPDLPQGDDVSVSVQLAAFYFKLWAYRSEYVSSFDRRQRQISPMFVAATPRVVKTQFGIDPFWSWIVGAAFLIALLSVATSAWLFRRADRQFRETRMRREAAAGEIPSLDHLAIGDKDERVRKKE